jgi:FtsH-binding integral membrane protein
MGVTLPAGTLVRTGVERATLVRRTYSLVFIGVLCTIAGVAFGLANPRLRGAVLEHPIITLLCVFAPLFMALRAPREFPRNIAFTLLFTVVEGIWLSPFIAIYGQSQPGLISQAAMLTVGTFGALTFYAFVSRRDFSALGQFFTMGLWVLIGTSLLNLFFRNPTADLWLAGGTVAVFGGLLIFDTWRIRNVYGPEDYVAAAVQIYLDLLNLFLAFVRILGGRRN